jgi:hypothetical protein
MMQMKRWPIFMKNYKKKRGRNGEGERGRKSHYLFYPL